MKRIIVVSIILIIALVCISCINSEGNVNMHENDHKIDKEHNVRTISDKIYTDEELQEIASFRGTLADCSNKYPFERSSITKEGNTRVIYKGYDKVTILEFDVNGSLLLACEKNVIVASNVFDCIDIGDDIDKVIKYDQFGDYYFLYSGRNDLPTESKHYTIDGLIITIKYQYDVLKKTYIVIDKKIEEM